MIADLRALIGNQHVEKWVEFRDGFELKLAYFPKRKARQIQEKRPEQRDDAFYQEVVKDWRGLTVRKLMEFCAIESAAPGDLNKEIPFSVENLGVLTEAVYDFDTFLVQRCTDVSLFKPELEGDLKNSENGQSGAALPKDSPVKSV